MSFNEIYTASTDAGKMPDLAATSLEHVQADDTRIVKAKHELENIKVIHVNAQDALRVKELASWADRVDGTRPVEAADLLNGIPTTAAAAQAWRQAFSTFCRLPTSRSGEITDEVNQLISGFVTHGVNMACLIDMVQLQLRTVGTDAASRTLSLEAAALHGLLDHLNIPATSQRLRDLLKELKIHEQAKDGDFEVPIKHATNARQDNKVLDVSPGHEDVYAHLRDVRYELQQGEMIDTAAQLEDDAMRFINPLLIGGSTADMGQEEISTALPHLGLDDIDITLEDIRSPVQNSTKQLDSEISPNSRSLRKQQVRQLLEQQFRNKQTRDVRPTNKRQTGADKTTGASVDKFKAGADVVGSQASTEGAEIERIVVRNEKLFQLDHEAIREKLLNGGGDNLDETIAKAGVQNRVTNPQALVLPDEFQPRKAPQEKWTYQLLAESEALTSMSADLISTCRMLLAVHLENEGKPLNIEWAIVIDNSGSMVRVADECVQTLVILIETLRRLECRFAVATLGDANRTRILKSLSGQFNMSVGEQVLAGLTYDESSHIATGVAAVADHVFSRSRGDAEPHERRIMILVTDGLSQEVSEKNFSDIRHNYDMELAVLHIQYGEGKHKAQYAKMLSTITNGLYFPVSFTAESPERDHKNENAVLPAVLSKLVVQVLRHILNPRYVHARQPQVDNPTDAMRSVNNLRCPTVAELQEELAHGIYPLSVTCADIRTALRQGAATRPPDMYRCSHPEASTTMMEKLEDILDSTNSREHSERSSMFQVSEWLL